MAWTIVELSRQFLYGSKNSGILGFKISENMLLDFRLQSGWFLNFLSDGHFMSVEIPCRSTRISVSHLDEKKFNGNKTLHLTNVNLG